MNRCTEGKHVSVFQTLTHVRDDWKREKESIRKKKKREELI